MIHWGMLAMQALVAPLDSLLFDKGAEQRHQPSQLELCGLVGTHARNLIVQALAQRSLTRPCL